MAVNIAKQVSAHVDDAESVECMQNIGIAGSYGRVFLVLWGFSTMISRVAILLSNLSEFIVGCFLDFAIILAVRWSLNVLIRISLTARDDEPFGSYVIAIFPSPENSV